MPLTACLKSVARPVVEGGKGLLILSRLASDDGPRHRLHFIFQEQQHEFDANEDTFVDQESQNTKGVFSGSSFSKSFETAAAEYSSTYRTLHRTIVLEVESSILLAHTDMRNPSRKTKSFDTRRERERASEWACCNCWNFRCCIPCIRIWCPNCPKTCVYLLEVRR